MNVTARSHLLELISDGPPVVDMNSTTAMPRPFRGRPTSDRPGEKPGRWSNGLDWISVFWIGMIHVGALAAPFFFTWKGLLVFLVLGWVSGGLGVCLGYHRLLTHRSFQTFRWCGGCWPCSASGGRGAADYWVAVHRKHHHHADKDGDPHSPRDGAGGATCFGSFRVPPFPVAADDPALCQGPAEGPLHAAAR